MKNIKQFLKALILIVLIILSIVFFPNLIKYYGNAEEIIRNSGMLGPIIYMFILILGILVSPIPTAPLAIIAGLIFGPSLGMIYTLIGATVGSVLAFLIARFFLRDYLTRYLENNKFYKKIKGKDNKNIAYFVFITRLMPQVSFDLISYLAGLTAINVFVFALATFLGMIPIVFMLTFFGSLLNEYMTTILIVSFIAFVAYIVYKIVITE